MAVDEDQVTGGKQIPLSLHHIASGAGQQEQELAELMVVVIHTGALTVPQMKEPEILQQVAPLLIGFIHGDPSLTNSMICTYYSIYCIYFASHALYNKKANSDKNTLEV